MEKNLKQFTIKSVVLVSLLLVVIFLFRFPIDLFSIELLSMNQATRLFSKSDALKIVALAILFFALYYKERIAKIKHPKQKPIVFASFIVAGLVSTTAYYALRYLANLYEITAGGWLYVVMFASFITLLVGFACYTIGVFSWSYLKKFYIALRKEILITGLLTVVAYYFLMFFQSLWPFFSRIITKLLYAMFVPFFPVYMELGRTPILDVNGFVVSIGAPCSGIESLFLFAAFSLGIYALDYMRLKKRQFLIVSIIGFVGIYFVNLFRLFLLMLAGIYIDPDFAVGLFHSNVGWILFVIYFFIYYYVITKFIYKSPPLNKK